MAFANVPFAFGAQLHLAFQVRTRNPSHQTSSKALVGRNDDRVLHRVLGLQDDVAAFLVDN